MQTMFDHRRNNFDFLRMALAVTVIYSHAFPLSYGVGAWEPLSVLTRGQVSGGEIAVDLFFIISGFLIAASFERSRTLGSFLKKRILRIYPGFLVALVAMAVVFLPLSGGHMSGGSVRARCFQFVGNALRLREFDYVGVFAGNPAPGTVNGAMWSIPYEFCCYLGVMALGVTGLLRWMRFLVVLFACSIALGVLFPVYGWAPYNRMFDLVLGYPPFWARLLPMYLAGVVFYRVRGSLKMSGGWIAGGCGMLVGAAVLPHGWPLLFPVAGAYLVLVVAFHPAIRLHGWNRFGDFSYGTYLYGFPVEQLLVRWIGHPVRAWEVFALATPVAAGCAALSWHGVEKWCLRLGGSGGEVAVVA